MLTIDSDNIGVITPAWTCRRIREYRTSISDYEEKSEVGELILSDSEMTHEEMKSMLKSIRQEHEGYTLNYNLVTPKTTRKLRVDIKPLDVG